MEPRVSVMTSEKGKFIIVRDGFKFYRKAVLKTGTEKWACIKKDCRAQFFTSEQISEGSVPEILDFKGTHDHEKVNEKKLQRGKISAQVKRKAVENACERPTKIVNSVLKVESFDKITTGDLSLIKRNAYNARRKSWGSLHPKCLFSTLSSPTSTHRHRVGHCEEELANIESSYQRSPNRSALGNDKQRKPHFQQEQLRFLKPGVTAARSGRDVSGTDSGAPPDVTSDADANHPGRHDVTIKIEPDDQLDIEHNLSTEDVEDPPKPSIFVTPLNYTPAIEEVTESVGKRPATEELCELQTKIQCLEASMEALKKTPTATLTPTPTQTPSRDSLGEQNGMRYFLLSLLPELETMPEEQIRAFKIKVMMLVDEIKSQSKR
ncbi:uncharacterized protein [Bemisia tabaci]|uniref:uncharacterized protein isoform X4 n=1 Tax=Bemisia tabaci TaxID=7038 RepID=UPI003B28AD67